MMNILCHHVSSLLKPVMPASESQAFVGRLMALPKGIYVAKMKELSFILQSFLVGEFQPPKEQLKYWGIKELNPPKSVMTADGREQVIHWTFNDPVVEFLMFLPHGLPRTDSILSGLRKLHTYAQPGTPSRTEVEEIRSTISDGFNGDQRIFDELKPYIRELVPELCYNFRVLSHCEEYLPLAMYPASVAKSSYCISDTKKGFTAKRSSLDPFRIEMLLRDPEIQALYHVDPDAFITYGFTGEKVVGGKIIFSRYPELNDPIPKGKISIIPEIGLKYRVVAQPHLLMNSLAYPLAGFLKAVNRNWRIQGVYSHSLSAETVHKWIRHRDLNPFRSAGSFHSIDMKSFTDRLPYVGLQQEILATLVSEGYISEFDKKVNDLICLTGYNFRNSVIYYGVGTPMGTFPSYPLATMANGLLLWISTWKALGKKPDKNHVPAIVIGDDVVIARDDVAEEYKTLMTRLGVEISPLKTVTSSRVAEICSKICTNNGVYEQKKVKPVSEVSQLVHFFEYFGEEALTISEEFSKKIYYLMSLTEGMGLGRSRKEILSSNYRTYWETVSVGLSIGSELRSYLHPNVSEEDYQLLEARRSLYPLMHYERVDRPYSVRELHVLPIVYQSLVEDACRIYERLTKETRSEPRLKLASMLIELYKILVKVELTFNPLRDGELRLVPLDKTESPDSTSKLLVEIERHNLHTTQNLNSEVDHVEEDSIYL